MFQAECQLQFHKPLKKNLEKILVSRDSGFMTIILTG